MLELLTKGADELQPREFEPAKVWFQRIQQYVPKLPEQVAVQWIYEHSNASPYEDLVISTRTFRKENWTIKQFAEVTGNEGEDPEFFMGRWSLSEYMRSHRTWPVPIVVLDNSRPSREVASWAFGRRQLLEGHRRLSFIRQLAAEGASESQHDVWVATYPLDPEYASSIWPPLPLPERYISSPFDPRTVPPITIGAPICHIPQEIFDAIAPERDALTSLSERAYFEFLDSVRQRLVREREDES